MGFAPDARCEAKKLAARLVESQALFARAVRTELCSVIEFVIACQTKAIAHAFNRARALGELRAPHDERPVRIKLFQSRLALLHELAATKHLDQHSHTSP